MSAKFAIDLGAYADEVVGVELADTTDCSHGCRALASQVLGRLKARGKLLQFKGHADGIVQLSLKADAGHPGSFVVKAKGRNWFASSAANESAGNTRFRLTIGRRCFQGAVTKKR